VILCFRKISLLPSQEFPLKHHINERWFFSDYEKYRNNPYNGRKFIDNKFEQAYVDENAYMSLDDDLKKKYVVLDPSAEPFKLHHYAGLDHFFPSKDALELTVMPVSNNYSRGGFKKRESGGGRGRFNNNYHHQGGYHPNNNNNRSDYSQTPQMSYVSEIERDSQYQEAPQQEQTGFYQSQQAQTDGLSFEGQQTYQPMQAVPQIYHQQSQNWNGQMVSYIPQGQYPIPMQQIPFAPLSYQNVMPFGNFSIPPPTAISQTVSCQPTDIAGDQTTSVGIDALNLLRDHELSSKAVDWKPKESIEENGSDLPMTDIPTLRFYFNLGVRYFLDSRVQRRLENVVSQLETIDLNEGGSAATGQSAEVKASEVQKSQIKIEPPPVPTNTPVSTKPVVANYGPPGNRYSSSSSNNHRRPPFGSNRDNGGYRGGNWNNNNPRKEIKFNSNVKNVHKVETKGNSGSKSSNSQSQAPVQSQTFHGSGVVAASTFNSVQDKTSPGSATSTSATQYSPISPISQDPPSVHHQPQMVQEYASTYPATYHQQQYVQQHQQQTFVPSPQQPGMSMIYQMNEDGVYSVQQVHQQPMPYTPQPYRKEFNQTMFKLY
jgi:hypothetical protein